MLDDPTAVVDQTAPPSSPDAAPAASPAPAETSPAPVYTQEQLEEIAAKRVNDALAEKGRDAKALAEQADFIKKEDARLKEEREAFRKQREEAEEAAVRDDPDAFAALRRRREDERRAERIQQQAEANEAKERELAEKEAALAASNAATLAATIAAEFQVDAAALLKRSDGTLEDMRTVAAFLPKRTAPAGQNPSIVPDPGNGAGMDMDWTRIQQAYIDNPRDPAVNAAYTAGRKARGL